MRPSFVRHLNNSPAFAAAGIPVIYLSASPVELAPRGILPQSARRHDGASHEQREDPFDHDWLHSRRLHQDGRPRTLAIHQRRPTNRNRQSWKNSGALPSKA